ncbi:hypothetical protein K9N68_03520 [Kovacikia minuta CCNUW1]|uniref:hypothetical protein n=1 Tax=Kovacikia minuta TaxID=2931930 RepID=UPI001CC91C54|nr:hypothetical protein [Kovacikia minuta]UBF27055.1 hypothetical protein K9N68_03520 [Kovacikia minuta CCNUW1]
MKEGLRVVRVSAHTSAFVVVLDLSLLLALDELANLKLRRHPKHTLKQFIRELQKPWMKFSLSLSINIVCLWLLTEIPQHPEHWEEAAIIGLWLIILLNCYVSIRGLV